MIKVNLELKFTSEWTKRIKIGTVAEIDAIKMGDKVVLFRVINIWKNPQWFGERWFK